MIFEIKSDLPIATQNKIDYIQAITPGNRTVNQTAFLTSLAPYLTNLVISVGTDGLITTASGLTVPTGYSGFRKGATFIKTDATGNGTYMNTGTTTVAAWDLVDQSATANIDDHAVTGVKVATNLIISYSGLGENASGGATNATVTGVKDGDILLMAFNVTDSTDDTSLFEATANGDDTISQLGSDLSAKTLRFLLLSQQA